MSRRQDLRQLGVDRLLEDHEVRSRVARLAEELNRDEPNSVITRILFDEHVPNALIR